MIHEDMNITDIANDNVRMALFDIILEEACRQWCAFIDEYPERKSGEGFAYFFYDIFLNKEHEYAQELPYLISDDIKNILYGVNNSKESIISNENSYIHRPLYPDEQKYTYRQSQQIAMQTGFIGYLRADMGASGKEFFSAWNDFNEKCKTAEFKTEFDNIINDFRSEGGILESLISLKKYCTAHPEAHFDKQSREYGVRVDTEKYSYLMRLNPNQGEYNLYCYCYEKEWLDRHIEKASKGIRFITPNYEEKFRIPDGDQIRITLSDGKQIDRICRYIDDYHVEIGDSLYHICQHSELMAQAENTVVPLRSSLPEQCYVFVQTENRIGIVKKGESGYYSTEIKAETPIETKKLVNEMNEKLGVSKAQAEAMKAGSMFGWDTPAADPANYNTDGKLIKNNRNDRSDAR